MFAIFKREIRSYFQTVVGWLFYYSSTRFIWIVFLCL